jgi:NADP-dependent 3-hydroxy acid dehydrogenase YdfG
MKREIAGSVVVITGASSGIGRAAAYAFADEGARLVLAARDAAALNEVKRACEERGVEAIVVPTDVGDEAAVRSLRDEAVRRFGRIDTWVNDAAVYMMGRFEDTPAHAFRRLFETNVLGVVHGAQAAVEQFRKQGSGVLINLGSAAAHVSYAQASAYCASKHAVRAIGEAMRQELLGTDIHVCTVSPATVDTPLFQHAANYSGREIQAMRPIYAPERVAKAIVATARRPRREVRIGGAPAVMTLGQMLMPGLFERMQPKMIDRDHLRDAPAPPDPGELYQARGPHEVRGGWQASRSMSWKMAAGMVAAAVVPLAFAVRAVTR